MSVLQHIQSNFRKFLIINKKIFELCMHFEVLYCEDIPAQYFCILIDVSKFLADSTIKQNHIENYAFSELSSTCLHLQIHWRLKEIH